MREIKFRAWDTAKKIMYSAGELGKDELCLNPDGRGFVNVSSADQRFSQYMRHIVPLQYTGLKDKNGLSYIYECDIIGVDGIVKGNKYENESLLQDRTNLVIEGFGTKNWWSTYQEAMARGCQDSE